MDPSTIQAAQANIFDSMTNMLTVGLLPDLKTAILAVGGLIAIYVAFDICAKILTGESITARGESFASDMKRRSDMAREETEYAAYKNKRMKSEYFRLRYKEERSSSAGMLVDKSVPPARSTKNLY